MIKIKGEIVSVVSLYKISKSFLTFATLRKEINVLYKVAFV